MMPLLSMSADYVVIDCSSHVLSSILTGVALETADTVFRVINADIKSLIHFRSQQYFLREARYRYDMQINVLNNLYPNQNFNPHREELSEIPYIGKRESCIMAELAKSVHIITTDEVDNITWTLDRKYAKLYSGQQLRDRVSACHELKDELLRMLNK